MCHHVYCVNTTLAEHAYYTVLCSVQQLLHSVTITPVPPPQAPQKLRQKLRIYLPLFYIIVFWPFDNFPNGISGISWKGPVKQETRLTSIVYNTLFMFSEKKMKKVMKSIEDSFEYTQRSNEFEQIHNTPEKILNYADTIVAEIEKKERLLSKRKPKQLFFGDEDFIHTE